LQPIKAKILSIIWNLFPILPQKWHPLVMPSIRWPTMPMWRFHGKIKKIEILGEENRAKANRLK